MAIGKKVVTQTETFELKTLDGEPTNVWFTVESANNPRAKKATQEANVMALMSSDVTDFENPSEEDKARFAVSVMANNSTVMAACIVGWEWNGEEFLEGEGTPEFTPSEVLRILTTDVDGIDILGQVQAVVTELGKSKPTPKKA